jgi:hypothetical protein
MTRNYSKNLRNFGHFLRDGLFAGTCIGMMASTALAAGGTSSGGGNGFSNRHNPWFLENTPSVNYCIDIDETAMGVSYQRAAELAASALQYWTTSFAQSQTKEYESGELKPFGQLRVATQVFKLVDCSEPNDLRLQLGKLASPAQELVVGAHHDAIGLAMRTQYDNVNLRGSGFVFVTPQTGPLRTRAVGFSSEAWSVCNGCLLELALKHELGHVFGVGHDGDDDKPASLMAHHFLAEVTAASVVRELKSSSPFATILKRVYDQPFFSIDAHRPLVTNAHRSSRAGQVLGLSDEQTWIQVRILKAQTGAPEIRIESFEPTLGQSGSGSVQVLARSCGDAPSSFDTLSSRGSLIHLPTEQAIFSHLPQRSGVPERMLPASHHRSQGISYTVTLCTTSPQASVQQFGAHLTADRTVSTLIAAFGNSIDPEFLQESPGDRFWDLLPSRFGE